MVIKMLYGMVLCVIASIILAADIEPSQCDIDDLRERIENIKQDIFQPLNAMDAMKFSSAPEGSQAAKVWNEWMEEIEAYKRRRQQIRTPKRTRTSQEQTWAEKLYDEHEEQQKEERKLRRQARKHQRNH